MEKSDVFVLKDEDFSGVIDMLSTGFNFVDELLQRNKETVNKREEPSIFFSNAKNLSMRAESVQVLFFTMKHREQRMSTMLFEGRWCKNFIKTKDRKCHLLLLGMELGKINNFPQKK
jgi:hypothetical protein